ncbi:hypothetical protein F5J12DRAFT_916980 [Pisolithus orientalis]|uniref:uncharacterized protein n=1 Tax=Pisolithus orientalis TaxID=936130 RepID=UPI0022248625|nr:uncharacterized protein F5J12DRAFT_916980 [Pisolithus orientalis]KAI5981892.1 hypothetical protein F5J12DRAFT_916980 [Pisolithus orientalis]
MFGNGSIYSVVVAQDGRWIVTGDRAGNATIWNAATHEKVRELTEHSSSVFGVDISSDSTKIATADHQNAQIFSFSSGIRLLPPLRHILVNGVRFSPDGNRFATVSHNEGFRVYSTHNGDVLFESGQNGSVSSSPVAPLAWSSDGQQLFVANKGKITCLDLSKSLASEWSIHDNQHRISIAFNDRFIACTAGSSVSLWDCVSRKQISAIITHTAEVKCIAFSPSGRYLACGNGWNITIHNLGDVLAFDPAELHASQLPLVQMSDETLKSWTQVNLTNIEAPLSEEIASASSPSHHVLANRALIRVRLNHPALAIEDAKESLRVQSSPIGHIAMAVALPGQGDRGGALRTFDPAFHDCEPRDNRFLLLLKSILVFESGNQEEAITRVEDLATRANNNSDDEATYLYTQACGLHVLGVMCMKAGDYKRTIPLIEHAKRLAPKDKQCPPLVTISLIFGWNFNGLDIIAQQHLCETFFTEQRTTEAMDILFNIIRTSDEETLRSEPTADWIADFTKRCATTLEQVGDEAFGFAASSPSPTSPAGLFIKRSRARAAKGLWEDALQDANMAVKVDSFNPWGHETKYLVLHGAKRYDDAIDAFKSMLQVIEQSHDFSIKQLRKNYVSPSEAIAVIDCIVRETLKNCPLVVIHVASGCLCDVPERIRIFKADPSFKELVSSMTTDIDNERIRRVITGFFGYVMFSHAWQGNEPSFEDVNVVKSVWNLSDEPLNKKLRKFCEETRRLGYNWAWSDTCCIDKSTSSVLNQSLTSMYKWYASSAATLVFLAGVAHPSKPGDLTGSLWMTRAWTLQELLSPKVIFFYDCEWKPYLGNIVPNHKESPEIMQELADAIKIPRGTIITFSPDDLGVHEKLRLASTRNATVEEDAAYSLIGIFKSDIRPHYGEGADAIGHLLEEIVARTGEVTVLAWSGKSSSYNSCLPASISVYSQIAYNPPPLEGEEMEKCINELRGRLTRHHARIIYNNINRLSPARFATRRLHLPCVVFSVKSLENPCNGNEKLYRARVSGLENVEFTTADDLPLHEAKKFVFVNPWIHHIRGPSNGVTWGDGSESDTNSDADEVASLPTVPMPPVDSYTRALAMIARLGQPFNALLLVQQSNRTYKRVATGSEIVVPGPGTNITPKNIRAKVLEIL